MDFDKIGSEENYSETQVAGKVNLSSFSIGNSSETEEAYLTLRSNLLFCGNGISTVLVTSCSVGDGKSIVAMGLAESLAKLGKRTVLVDADLRHSSILGKSIKNRSISGITEFISGIATVNQVVFNTQIPGFDVIFTGRVPQNPVEMLSGLGFREAIEKLKEKYDYVIIDSPALGEVIDAAVIAGCCDGSVIVIPQDKIKYKDARSVAEQLKRSGSKILGVVMKSNKKSAFKFNSASKKAKK